VTTTRYRAAYFDGRTAARHAVAVGLSSTWLELIAGDGTQLDVWPLVQVRVVPAAAGDGRLVLAPAAGGSARLVVEDAAFRDALRTAAPELFQRTRARRTLAWVAGGTVLTVAFAAALWFGVPRMSAAVAVWLPAEWLVSAGDRIAAQFHDDWGRCETEAGTAALAALTADLTSGAGLGLPVRVSVADVEIVNAFALPGGRILLTRGLLEQAGDASAVAGVLAHELGHVAGRHPTQGAVRALGTTFLLDTFFGGGFVETAASVGGALLLLSYSRDMELEADRYAVARLRDRGIGASGLRRFFITMDARTAANGQDWFRLPDYLGTHPQLAERAARIDAEATEGRPVLSARQWRALQRICARDRPANKPQS